MMDFGIDIVFQILLKKTVKWDDIYVWLMLCMLRYPQSCIMTFGNYDM